MTSLNRIVPVSLCLASAMLLSGFALSSSAAPALEPAFQKTPETPAKPAPPANPTASRGGTPSTPAPDAPKPQPQIQPQISPTPVPPPSAATPQNFIVKAEPNEIDMGEIPTNDTGKGQVKLVNTGDKPMTIQSARA